MTTVICTTLTDSSSALEESGADLSMTGHDRQLLHSKEGCICTARTLNQWEASLNVKDRQGLTPLHKAVQADNMHNIQLLIEVGANSSCKLIGGETLLMFAIANSSFSAASLLLSRGMHINDQNTSGDTALHLILKEYKNIALSLALDQINLTSSRIRNIVKFITDHNGDVNITNAAGETALHIAAGIADVDVVESLLATGAVAGEQNNAGDTPLHIAVSSNNSTILEKLVCSSSPDICIKNASGKSPLHLAVSCGFIDCLKILMESGGNLNTEDNLSCTPLCTAALKGNITIVEMLCKEKVNINHPIKNLRKMPLHLAIEKGYSDTVKVLLDKGADVHAKAKGCITDCRRSALTPLHYAAIGGHFSIVRSLIERGAGLEAKTSDDLTPLHLAAEEGHLSAVRELLASGADIEARHYEGYTPLHMAAMGGNLSTVQELCARGANIEAEAGVVTPQRLASAYGKFDVASFLRSKMR